MATQTQEWLNAAQLVRATGFGATGTVVDSVVKSGTDAFAATVLQTDPTTDPGALRTPPPTFQPIAPLPNGATTAQRHTRNTQLQAELHELGVWWLRRMVTVDQPVGEKLTFCWHNHFATAATKVRNAQRMLMQNASLRTLGRGDFRPLGLAMLTDAAMLDWLDGQQNTAAAPNENLSREFMELFALGHGDGYTENDVREGARALTGWRISSDGSTRLVTRLHDSGPKTFLGVTGNLDVVGYCDAILHRPAGAKYIATRWWGQLASTAAPTPGMVNALAAAYGPSGNLTALFTTLLGRPEFIAAQRSRVITPVEWLVGALRTLKVPVANETDVQKMLSILQLLGQVPFYPPSVAGWPWGQAWLSTTAAETRMTAAAALVAVGDVSTVTQASAGDRIDAVGYLLGVGNFGNRTTTALRAQLDNPELLVAIALNTPEYLVA